METPTMTPLEKLEKALIMYRGRVFPGVGYDKAEQEAALKELDKELGYSDLLLRYGGVNGR